MSNDYDKNVANDDVDDEADGDTVGVVNTVVGGGAVDDAEEIRYLQTPRKKIEE